MRSQYRLVLDDLNACGETRTDRRAGRAPSPGTLRLVREERPGLRRPGWSEAEGDAELRELTVRAQALIRALRSGAAIGGRPGVLSSYVDAARAIGVTGERLHDALELLVNEHAPSGSSSVDLLELLRLADPSFRAGRCPHGAASVSDPVPHWCRVGRRAP